MALITSTSDPVLHAALVAERAKFEAEGGWVIYQNLHYKVHQTDYKVHQTDSGEVAFEHHDSEETAKSTSF
jgi:hypothetical protein